MDPLEARLKNKLFINSIKFLVAMDTVLELIKPFIKDKLAEFHLQLLRIVNESCRGCSDCTEGRLCQQKIIAIRKTVSNFHMTGKPSFLSSIDEDVLKYPWHLAKFYMSSMPENKRMTDKDADFQSCISIITNNTHIIKYIDDIAVYDKANGKRNRVLAHSPNHEITDKERDACFLLLKSIMDDMHKLGYCSDHDMETVEKIKTSVLEMSTEKICQAISNLDFLDLDDKEVTVEHFLGRFRHQADTETKHTGPFYDFCHQTLHFIANQFILKPQLDQDLLRNEWNFNTFLVFIQNRKELKSLPERYKQLLRPHDDKDVDLSKWDLFMKCFISSLPLNIPLEDEFITFMKDIKVVRDKLLDNPQDMNKLEFRDVMVQFRCYRFIEDVNVKEEPTYTQDDNLFARLGLAEWQRMDLKSNNRKVNQEFVKHIQSLAQGYLDMEKRLSDIEKNSPSTSQQNPTATKHVTRAIVEILDGNDDKVTNLVASPNRSENINNGLGRLEDALVPSKLVGVQPGCLIVEVECPLLQFLFQFWKSCLDGMLSSALECLRIACKLELGLDDLRFEVVLTESEVLRCMNIIAYDFTMNMMDIAERLISQGGRAQTSHQGSSVMTARFERLEPIDMADYNIQRCQFMPDGHLLLACWNCLVLVNKDLKDVLSLLDTTVWDLAVVNDSEIVTVMKNKFMHYITVTPPNMSLGVKIDVGHGVKCISIDVAKDKVYIICELRGNQQLRILTPRGDNLETFELNKLRSGGIVTVKLNRGADKIFLSKWIKNEVLCLSERGAQIDKYVADSLKGPEAVFVDDEDNIIVCGFLSHNVHIFDRHGKRHEVIFTADDGIKFPHGVCYRKEDSCLIIGQFGKILPFKLAW